MGELYLDKSEIIKLASKISEGSATDEEIRRYNSIFRQFQQDHKASIDDADSLLEVQMMAHINDKLFKTQTKSLQFWITRVAASLFLVALLAGGFYIFNHRVAETEVATRILPGSNKAILTLANGEKVVLDENQGVISLGAVGQASNDTTGFLKYDGLEASGENLGFNTMETPRGGIYSLMLSDGTKVWLNSASKLRYPVRYQSNERVVELDGEAYFEVAKVSGRPFKVKSKGQLLEVLGTHFNLNSYADEPYITTTLLEGSVALSAGTSRVRLSPLQQALWSKGGFLLRKVSDGDEVLAWKNGYFQFDDEDLESVLRKISRWYDVDIEFVGKPTRQKFNGSISRSKGIKKALEIIAATGNVSFKIEGRTLIVKI